MNIQQSGSGLTKNEKVADFPMLGLGLFVFFCALMLVAG